MSIGNARDTFNNATGSTLLGLTTARQKIWRGIGVSTLDKAVLCILTLEECSETTVGVYLIWIRIL